MRNPDDPLDTFSCVVARLFDGTDTPLKPCGDVEIALLRAFQPAVVILALFEQNRGDRPQS
jgi:hypothetical protein